MRHIKSSINVKYIIEYYNNSNWKEVDDFGYFIRIQNAIDELERLKKSRSSVKFRLIRSEWQVIG